MGLSRNRYQTLTPTPIQNSRRLVIRASTVAMWLGYTDHLRLMVDALSSFGVNILIRPGTIQERLKGDYHPLPPSIRGRFVAGLQPEPWELLLSPPSEKPTPGKRTVYFTMWESTKLNPEAVANLNLADVVVVPCDWNSHCFRASGVRVPIRVCHLGMDPGVYRFHPMPSTRPFVFGAAGRLHHGETRKGIWEAIIAFQAAFPTEDWVRLKVKCFKDDPLPPFPDDERVVLERRYLSDRQFALWLASLHCLVALAKGEGWGAIQHQAMMVGRPVMGPIYSGTEMFMTKAASIPTRYTLAKPPSKNYYAGLGYWAVPDMVHVIELMRHMAANPEEAQRLSGPAHTRANNFTHYRSNLSLLRVLLEFGVL